MNEHWVNCTKYLYDIGTPCLVQCQCQSQLCTNNTNEAIHSKKVSWNGFQAWFHCCTIYLKQTEPCLWSHRTRPAPSKQPFTFSFLETNLYSSYLHFQGIGFLLSSIQFSGFVHWNHGSIWSQYKVTPTSDGSIYMANASLSKKLVLDV